MIYALVAFSLFGGALAQVPGLGGCPNVTAMKNFDVEKYMGKWYEAERFFAAFELTGKCVTANYTLLQNGTVRVVNSQISSLTGNPSNITGIAYVPDRSEPAKLKVKFDSVPFGIEGNYWILGTDYVSYSVVHSCGSLAIVNFSNAWILTRDQNPSDDVIAKADKVIEANNLRRSAFMKTNQKDC